MIVAEDMQRAVHGEAHELFSQTVRRSGPKGLPDGRGQAVAGVSAHPPVRLTAHYEGPCSSWADVHVAEDRAVGLRQGEGDHVGQAAASRRPPVEASHRGGTEQGQLDARPARPFPPQHARRNPRQGISRPQRAAPAARPS